MSLSAIRATSLLCAGTTSFSAIYYITYSHSRSFGDSHAHFACVLRSGCQIALPYLVSGRHPDRLYPCRPKSLCAQPKRWTETPLSEGRAVTAGFSKLFGAPSPQHSAPAPIPTTTRRPSPSPPADSMTRLRRQQPYSDQGVGARGSSPVPDLHRRAPDCALLPGSCPSKGKVLTALPGEG